MKYRLFIIPAAIAVVVAGFTLTGGASDTPSITVPAAQAAAPVPLEVPAPVVMGSLSTAETAGNMNAITPVAASAAVVQAAPAAPARAVPAEDPNVDRTLIPTPAPAPTRTVCQIKHAVHDDVDAWAVSGATNLPVGTVLTYTLTADGQTQTIPLTVRQGSTMVDGQRYGSEYEEIVNLFGSTTLDVVIFRGSHGPVTASVTHNGTTFCSAA